MLKKIILLSLTFFFFRMIVLNGEESIPTAIGTLKKGIGLLVLAPGNVNFIGFIEEAEKEIEKWLGDEPQPPLPDINFKKLRDEINRLIDPKNSGAKTKAEEILEKLKDYYKENTIVIIKTELEKVKDPIIQPDIYISISDRDEKKGSKVEIKGLDEGEHRVKVVAKGYKEAEEPFEIKTGKKLVLNISLKAKKDKVEITTHPEGASVHINEIERGVTPLTVDNLIVSELVGSYSVKIEKTGYYLVEEKIEVPGGYKFNLPEKPGILNLHTEPVVADIFIGEVGPFEKKENPYKKELPSGNYKLKIEASGYKSAEEDIRIKVGETLYLTKTLNPETSSLIIESIPDEAEIKINEEKKGVTPLTIENLPISEVAGKYRITLSKEDYYEEEVEVNIKKDLTVKVRGKLKPKPGKLELRVEGPVEAKVEFNGKSEKVRKEIIFDEVPAGRYHLKTSSDGYVPIEEDVLINPNKTTSKTIQLEPEKGRIQIESNPSWATVYIRGDKQEQKTPFSIDLTVSKVTGKYSLKLEKDRYKTVEAEFEVVKGDNPTLKYNLDKLPPEILLWEKEVKDEVESITTFENSGSEVIVAGLKKGQLLFLDDRGKIIKNVNAHNGSIYKVDASSETKQIITVGYDKPLSSLKSWDFSGKSLWRAPFINEYALSIALSPNGNTLLASFREGLIRFIDTQKGSKGEKFQGQQHNQKVWALTTSPTGKLALSGDDGGTVILWDTTKRNSKKIWQKHDNNSEVRTVSFSHDEKLFLSAGYDGKIYKVNIEDYSYRLLYENKEIKIKTALFSLDGNFIIAGDNKGIVRIWRTSDGELLKEFQAHQKEVNGLAFTKKDRFLITCGSDKKIKIWK